MSKNETCFEGLPFTTDFPTNEPTKAPTQIINISKNPTNVPTEHINTILPTNKQTDITSKSQNDDDEDLAYILPIVLGCVLGCILLIIICLIIKYFFRKKPYKNIAETENDMNTL